MRDKSFRLYTQSSLPSKSRGGEKKVMKKSLSLLLAFALVFSMFSSLAFAADELSDEQKYEALKAAGIFAGMPDGSAGLDQKMTRAQFARVAGLLAGLDVDAKPTTKTFSDVAETHWAYEEIEAAAAAGLVEGMGDGTFNPSGNVTIQQLAVVAAKILKLDPVEDAKVEGAADWAAPYIQALLNVGIALPTNYKDEALRADLVNVSYEVAVNTGVIAPEKVSVVSAQAVGIKKIEVKLNKAVDTEKATFTIKKGNLTVGYDSSKTTWSDDKKTVTLETNNKITAGDYTVTLGGLDASTIGTASASFSAEDETVTKIEFVTTSDEIAHSNKSRIKVRPENQYGELASFQSANYTVSAPQDLNPKLSRDDEGYLIVTLDTKTSGKYTPGLSQIPVYVLYNGNHVTAQKTFKLGFEPFVSKMEVSDIKYENGRDSLVNKGDTATAQITLYDQYGNPVAIDQVGAVTFNKNVIPYSENIEVGVDDYDNDDEYELRITLKEKEEKSGTYTATIYAGSSSQTVSFQVTSSRVATKLEFAGFDGVLATGDKDKYVELIVYDANDEQLTKDEIADNASRIKISGSGADVAPTVVTVGPHKGKIHIREVTAGDKGYVFLQASILTPYSNSFKTYQIPVVAAREPASLKVVKANKPKAILGGETEFEIHVLDQHGEKFGSKASANYGVLLKLSDPNGVVSVVDDDDANTPLIIAHNGKAEIKAADFDKLNDGLIFKTDPTKVGSAVLTAELYELGSNNDFGGTGSAEDKLVANPVRVSIETLDPAKAQLNYSLKDMGTLFAAGDSSLLTDSQKDVDDSSDWHLHKSVELVVKDNAGNEVAYPSGLIKSISAENSNVVIYDSADNKVLGNKAGETTVTAVVYKANGETAFLTTKVTVKADPVVVDKLEADGEKYDPAIVVNTTKAYDLMNLKVVDQYGIEYKGEKIKEYDRLLGIRYTVSNISEGITVEVDPTTGVIKQFNLYGKTTYQFVITAQAPNGKSVSTLIFRD